MKWRFWTKTQRSQDDGCVAIKPLLSLYFDHMLSSDDTIQVESHLTACLDCQREALWMKATQTAILQRPAAAPSPDLQARILRAVAAANTPSISVRPVRRSFVTRPAIAAFATSLLVGAVAITLHFGEGQPSVPVVKNPPPHVVAVNPMSVSPLRGKKIKVHQSNAVHIAIAKTKSNVPMDDHIGPLVAEKSEHFDTVPTPVVPSTNKKQEHATKSMALKPHPLVVSNPKIKLPLDNHVIKLNHNGNNSSNAQVATNVPPSSSNEALPRPSDMTLPVPVTVPKNAVVEVASNTQEPGSLRDVYNLYSAHVAGSQQSSMTAVRFADYHGSGRQHTTDTSTEQRIVAPYVGSSFH